MTKLLVLPVVLILAGGCGLLLPGDPFYDDYTCARPEVADVVGAWVATADSVAWLRAQGYAVASPPSIDLKADGTFTMTGMPDGWRVFFERERRRTFESAAGRWELGRHQQWWALDMHFETLDGRPWPRASYNQFHVRREQPPYLLHVTIGDPDAGERVEFEKP